jgi:hypothetical protein
MSVLVMRAPVDGVEAGQVAGCSLRSSDATGSGDVRVGADFADIDDEHG